MTKEPTAPKGGAYSADLIMRFEEIHSPIMIHRLTQEHAEVHSKQTAELVIIIDGEEERRRVEITEIKFRDIK